jgi:hypothetical protein
MPKITSGHLNVGDERPVELRSDVEQLQVESNDHRSLLEFRGRFAVAQALSHDEERAVARAHRAQRLAAVKR